MIKYPLITWLLITLFNGIQAQEPSPEAVSKFNKLKWLTGTWNRTNAKPGRNAHERWEMAGNYEMKGWGITRQGQDTVFVEKLKLVIKDNKVGYIADIAENKEPVFFELTQVTENGFTCENPAHDFPQKITYKREGKKLTATISGDDKAISFLFEKQ